MAFAFALRVPLSYWWVVLNAIAVPMLLVQLAISVLNDWADRERDATAGRPRPVATGMVRPGVALGLAPALGAAALAWSFGAGDGLQATILLGLGLAAGFAYDLWFKPTPLSALPFAVAFPLLLVWLSAVVGYGPPAWIVFLSGAPLAAAIHLADAIPDLPVDGAARVRTLAVVLGARRATLAGAGLLGAGSAVMALVSLGSRPWTAIFVLLIGAGAGAAMVAGMTARWIVAAAAVIETVAWLASGGW